MTTRQPAAMNCSAAARPMPDVAPVMKAVRVMSASSFQYRHPGWQAHCGNVGSLGRCKSNMARFCLIPASESRSDRASNGLSDIRTSKGASTPAMCFLSNFTNFLGVFHGYYRLKNTFHKLANTYYRERLCKFV